MRKLLPNRSTFVVILLIVGLLIAPIPHVWYDEPGSISSGIIWPASGDIELDYTVRTNSTTWWYDRYSRVNITITAYADISKIPRFFNLSYILIALNIEVVGRFFLVEDYLNGTEGIFTNISISGNWELFKIQRSFNVSIGGLSSLRWTAPKLNANLDIILKVRWYTSYGTEKETELSNFRSGGVQDWIPRPFPIIIDNPPIELPTSL